MSLDRPSCRNCSSSAEADLRARLMAAVLAPVPVEVQVGDRVVRAAVHDGSLVVVLCLPVGALLDDVQRGHLADLGFAPDDARAGWHGTAPRWWQQVDVGPAPHAHEAVAAIAGAVVAALTGALAVPRHVVDADLRRTAPLALLPFRPGVGPDGTLPDPAGLDLDYGAHLLAAAAAGGPLWSTTAPLYAAVVPVADPTSVRELVALAPGPDGGAAWYRRTRYGWVADPTVRRRLVERAAAQVRQDREALRLLDPAQARELEDGLCFDDEHGPGHHRDPGLS